VYCRPIIFFNEIIMTDMQEGLEQTN